jgi:hypothetical protein
MRHYTVIGQKLSHFLSEVSRVGATATELDRWTTRRCFMDGLLCDRQSHCQLDAITTHISFAVGAGTYGDGWSFLAKVEHTPAGNIVSYPPTTDEALVAQGAFAKVSPACEHCRTNRDRKLTYIVQHADGRRSQVGSTCIDVFLGLPEGTCSHLKMQGMGDDDEDFDSLPRDTSLSLGELIAAGCCATRTRGWKSKTSAAALGGTPTLDVALTLMQGSSGDLKELERQGVVMTRQDVDASARVIAWGRNELVSDGSDYMDNLTVAIASDHVEYRHAGIAISLISAFNRAQEQAARIQAQRQSSASSQFIGNVGDKLVNVPMTATFTRIIDGNYGPSTLIRLLTAEGNIVVWYATGAREDIQKDHTYRVSGTIKAHKDDGTYGKQTAITRAKLVEVVNVAPSATYADFKVSLAV